MTGRFWKSECAAFSLAAGLTVRGIPRCSITTHRLTLPQKSRHKNATYCEGHAIFSFRHYAGQVEGKCMNLFAEEKKIFFPDTLQEKVSAQNSYCVSYVAPDSNHLYGFLPFRIRRSIFLKNSSKNIYRVAFKTC